MSDELINRAPGDDLVVSVLMRRSSFEALTARPDGHCVSIGNGRIGLVPADVSIGAGVYALVVWSPDQVWRGVPEAIPANQAECRCRAKGGQACRRLSIPASRLRHPRTRTG